MPDHELSPVRLAEKKKQVFQRNLAEGRRQKQAEKEAARLSEEDQLAREASTPLNIFLLPFPSCRVCALSVRC